MSRRLVLAAIGIVIVTIAATAWFRLPAPDALPRCLNTVLVAFETAQSPDEAQMIWKLLGDHQANLAKSQYPDFAFIAAYTFLFLLLANIGRRRPIASSRLSAKLVILSALLTAMADIGENLFTLANTIALKRGADPSSAYVDLMRHCSLTKWAACGVTLILLWWIFLPSRHGSALYRLLSLTIAFLSLISGGMGVLGMWDVTKIELVFPFLGPALLVQIPLFWWYWDDVLEDHAPIAAQPIETWSPHSGAECPDNSNLSRENPVA